MRLGACIFFGFVCVAHSSDLAERVAARQQKLAPSENPVSSRESNSPLHHPQWKSYLHCLLAYQKAFPGIYTPADLIRWDKIPQDWLQTQIRKHGRLWDLQKGKTLSMDDRRTEQTVLSRNANEELYRKLLEVEKEGGGSLWLGSTQFILDSLNENERVSLTPLDPVFQESDLGTQIMSRLKSDGRTGILSGFLIDKKSQRLILETSEAEYYKVEFQEASSPQEVLLRTFYGKSERLGSDFRLRRENFKGYLMNKSPTERLPLGPIPLKSNQWVDESGNAHFHGDGHKH